MPIEPQYIFSQEIGFSTRQDLWKDINWYKVNIGENTDILRYPYPKCRFSLVTKSGLLEIVEDKKLGFIACNLIDGACIWNQYKSPIALLLYPRLIFFSKLLGKENLPIMGSAYQSAQFGLFWSTLMEISWFG